MASTLGDSFSAKWSNVTAWRFRGCPIIKHAWTWGSNEVLEAEKTTVVSAILMIKSRGRMPAETTAKGTQAPTQLTLGQFDRSFDRNRLVRYFRSFGMFQWYSLRNGYAKLKKKSVKMSNNISITFRWRKH